MGVGAQTNLTSNYTTEVILKSTKQLEFAMNFLAMILGSLTRLLPKRTVSPASSTHLNDLDLADRQFFEPGRVDCILEGDVFHMLLLPGVPLGSHGRPAAQNTVMGWVVTGPEAPQSTAVEVSSAFCFPTTTSSLSDDLRCF